MRCSRNDALLMAITLDRVSDVRFHLLDPLVNPNFGEGLALRTAIQYGHYDIVCALLDDIRLDPTLGDNAPLLLAMRSGNSEVVKALLSVESDGSSEQVQCQPEDGTARLFRYQRQIAHTHMRCRTASQLVSR